MVRIVVSLALVAMLGVTQLPTVSSAGGPGPPHYGPPLDGSLMAHKEQGVWYFLCTAPHYPYRIPPHYLVYGPPPPACAPPPCVGAPCPTPMMPQKVRVGR